MKDKNGIDVCCENCAFYDGEFCDIRETFPECHKRDYFLPTEEAYKARIAELQKELDETEKKLTETIKLLSERSRECGELQALLEVKNRSDISTQSTDTEDVVFQKKSTLSRKNSAREIRK